MRFFIASLTICELFYFLEGLLLLPVELIDQIPNYIFIAIFIGIVELKQEDVFITSVKQS